MEAKNVSLTGVFPARTRLHVPIWQRPYVWGQKKQWEPLWKNIKDLAEERLAHQGSDNQGTEGQESESPPHFLGAVVHKQLGTRTDEGAARQIVDGQQRLTTLQIVIAALRDICKKKKSEQYEEAFVELSRNVVPSEPEGELKIWQRNVDREYFAHTMRAGSLAEIRELYPQEKHPIPNCYRYFYGVLNKWLGKAKGEELQKHLDCLYKVISADLVLVVIDIDKGEDANLIFETLNFLGVRLSPIDRVKNFLFHRVDAQKHEELYKSWKHLDDDRWWREGKEGDCPIDRFLVHYVTLFSQQYLGQNPAPEDLFRKFEEYYARYLGDQHREDKYPQQELASRHLQQLCSYAQSFYHLNHLPEDDPVTVFLQRSRGIGKTSASLPIVLKMFHETKDGRNGQKDDFHKALKYMESFLVRRVLCTALGDYHRTYFRELFPEMIQNLWDEEFSSTKIREFLIRGGRREQKWPSDEEFREAFCNRKAQAELMVLCAIADAMEEDEDSDKSEGEVILKKKPTIEHIMPEKWKENWDQPKTEPPSVEAVKAKVGEMQNIEQLLEGISEIKDQLESKDALEKREEVIQQFGNLTLLTPPLNSGLGNAGWSTKKKELSDHSKIAMNRDLLKYEDWNEDTIRQRGEELFEYALRIWPHPDTPQKP